MQYILEYNKFNQKTILYLHGLDAQKDHKIEIQEKYKKIVNDLGFNYVSIMVDYKKDNVWDIISKINIDGVIGHSLGGYMAYQLSNFIKIPSLLLMPSFDKNDIKLQSIPSNVKNTSFFKKKIALIGGRDKEVDLTLQEKNLKDCKIYYENIEHDLSEKYL